MLKINNSLDNDILLEFTFEKGFRPSNTPLLMEIPSGVTIVEKTNIPIEIKIIKVL